MSTYNNFKSLDILNESIKTSFFGCLSLQIPREARSIIDRFACHLTHF